jgi:hypothetical protein
MQELNDHPWIAPAVFNFTKRPSEPHLDPIIEMPEKDRASKLKEVGNI